MLAADKLIAGGRGLAPALVRRAATVELDWDVRQKSRFEATDSAGRRLGVFLARGRVVRGGDVLVAEDGTLVAVKAAPQPLLVVRQAPGGSPFDLLRAAYHLGNRHVPLALEPERLLLEPDPVLAEMLRRMGLEVEEALAPFEPEAGAYGGGYGEGQGHGHAHGSARGHGDGHGHDDDHAHDHAHDHDDAHDHGHNHADAHSPDPGVAAEHPTAPHVHVPSCGHNHP